MAVGTDIIICTSLNGVKEYTLKKLSITYIYCCIHLNIKVASYNYNSYI